MDVCGATHWHLGNVPVTTSPIKNDFLLPQQLSTASDSMLLDGVAEEELFHLCWLLEIKLSNPGQFSSFEPHLSVKTMDVGTHLFLD